MKIFSRGGNDKKDKSLGFFHGEAASASVESAGTAYQAPSLIAIGANAQSVALLSAVTHLVLSLLLIKVPSLVERQGSLKRTTLAIALINAITWVPLVLILLLFGKINTFLLIALWVVNLVPSILVGPTRDNWMSNLIPSDKMGRYLGWRSAIASASYLVGFYLMGYILDTFVGIRFAGYAIVTGIALMASFASAAFYSKIRSAQVKVPKTPQDSFGFFTFLKQTKHSHLGTFIIFLSMFTFAVNLSSPLFSAYMLDNLKFSYMTYTAMISCEYIARIISLSFWGKLVDKSGSLNLMMVVAHLIPFIPVMWLFSSNVFYLGIVQMFSGVVWAAFDLCAQAFIYKTTPPEQRLRYISYQRSLTTLSVALGAITGAFLLTHMIPVFGSQLLGVFLVSGLLRLVVVRVMLPRLRPDGIPDAIIHEELAVELARLNLPSREGLYYHPEKWPRIARPVGVFGTIIGKAINKIASAPAGLYYSPQKWSTYMGSRLNLQPVAEQSSTGEVKKSGLYHDKRAWSNYMRHTSAQLGITQKTNWEGLLHNPEALAKFGDQAASDTRAIESAMSSRKGLLYDREAWARFVNQTAMAEANEIDNLKVARNGLFYDSQKWTDYFKQSLVLNATTMRTANSLTNRQPIFYHPETWEYYKNQTAQQRVSPVKTGMPVRQPMFYHQEEWNKAFDPAVVRIGRKSAIGTVINKQNKTSKVNHKVPAFTRPTVVKPSMATKKLNMSPSLA